MIVLRILVLITASAACYFDVKTGKIPNLLLVLSFVLGMLFRFYAFGMTVMPYSMFGGLLALLPGAFLFHYRMIGAGDIKLLTVIGCIIGFYMQCRFLVWTILFAGILSAALLYLNGNLQERLRYFKNWCQRRIRDHIQEPYRREKGAENFHMSIPILAAACLYVAGMM